MLLLVFQAGCIPYYSDFVGAQDTRGGDAGTTDERSGDGGGEVAKPDIAGVDQRVCIDDVCVCEPDCAGKECGPNGCGGVCGSCSGCKSACTDEGKCAAAPKADSGCHDNDIYWKDSCGAWGEKATECGEAGCTPGSKVCTNCEVLCSDVECGMQGKCDCGTCPTGKSCQGGVCEYHCGDGLCANAGGGEDCETCEADCGACPGQCAPSCDPTLEECVPATTGGWVCTSKMVEIPAGNFWMGCNNCVGSAVNDTSCGSDEHPYHEVYLDGYEIDRTEVTAAQYLVCKTAGGCTAAGSGSYATYEVPGKEDHPVNYVNWSQAEDYCQWVGKELCTEAQWEKGARGGCEKNGGPSNCKAQSRKYPWGNETPTCDLAVKSGCDGDTQPVCSVSPAGNSPYGLCDMAGNVWEWTADWYQKDYYCDGDAASGDEYCAECGSWPGSPNAWSNPFGTISGSARVFRGGCFDYDFGSLRVSYRSYVNPSGDYYFLGLRCCRSE